MADQAKGKSVGEQTRDVLAAIDRLLAEAGSDKARILSATVYLSDIATLPDERRMGRLGRPGAYACPCDRRGEARRPAYAVEIACIAARA